MIDHRNFLATSLGDGLVLAHLGAQRGRKLWMLDPLAATIWQAHRAGLTPEEIATYLAEQCQHPKQQILADIVSLLDSWGYTTLPAANWSLHLGDRHIALYVDDPNVAVRLQPLLTQVQNPAFTIPDTQIYLSGSADNWQIFVGDELTRIGNTLDAALTYVLNQLMEAACATKQRLIILHAAGVSRDGQGIVLIGEGGSGKTTLATALNAHGWALLHDDVIPVTTDGQLLGLGLGPCLKPGSWSALALWLPNLAQTMPFDRLGQQVRIPLPPGPIERGPVAVTAFCCPHYLPGCTPTLTHLTPEQVLQAIIGSESVIPTLNQSRLDTLVSWVQSAPGLAITYPDLEQALQLIEC